MNDFEKLKANSELALGILAKLGTALSAVDGKSKKEDSGESLYVVKYRKGQTDCLWRIALNVYKDAKLWTVIYVANRDTIKNPDLIFPGQKLKIPAKPIAKSSFKETRKEVDKVRKGGGR